MEKQIPEIKLSPYEQLKADHPNYYRDYYQMHKTEKKQCECGGYFVYNHKSRHLATQKHKRYLDTNKTNTLKTQ